MPSGTRNGRAQLGLRHAQADHRELRGGEREQHAEAEEAREERTERVNDVPTMSTIAIAPAATTDAGETSVRRCSRPKTRGSCPCSPSEYARRPKPEIDVVIAASSTSAPVRPT